MTTGIEKILEKTGLKAKDINAKNYEKLKFMLSDEDIKIVEKKLGIDKIAPKKTPPGTKIGPGRKDIPANPHGVDDDTIYLEKGGPVDTPKKKRGNYGPNIGKPFKAMGPVGGLPVNKSGTKIMAGRLAARGYGKAKK